MENIFFQNLWSHHEGLNVPIQMKSQNTPPSNKMLNQFEEDLFKSYQIFLIHGYFSSIYFGSQCLFF